MAIKRSTVSFLLASRAAAAADTGVRSRPVDATTSGFDQAMRRFESGQWDEAFAELSDLANRGHPAAARIALMLVGRGTSLFGGRFAASPEERARWQRQCSS